LCAAWAHQRKEKKGKGAILRKKESIKRRKRDNNTPSRGKREKKGRPFCVLERGGRGKKEREVGRERGAKTIKKRGNPA